MRAREKALFLCTGNSCRSQMAEGFLRRCAADRFEAFSAGISPHGLNPLAVRAMREVGVDISAQRSQHVDEYLDQGVGTVITVCDRARESCPSFPEKVRMLHWSFDDPAAAEGSEEERMQVFRRVRDEIAAGVKKFVQQGGD